MRYCYIKGDYNDADFTSSLFPVTEEEEKEIKSIASKLKSIEHNYEGSGINERGKYETFYTEEIYEGVLTKDELETLDEIVPYGNDDGGIHTIIEVVFFDMENIDKAFSNSEYSGWGDIK